MEDLRWVIHKTKKRIGAFLSWWQIHLLFGMIYKKIEEKCKLYNIPFQLVPASYTGCIYGLCGAFDPSKNKSDSANITSRTSVFTCRNVAFHGGIYSVNSDLNSARNHTMGRYYDRERGLISIYPLPTEMR
jgi:hypothetical protein